MTPQKTCSRNLIVASMDETSINPPPIGHQSLNDKIDTHDHTVEVRIQIICIRSI